MSTLRMKSLQIIINMEATATDIKRREQIILIGCLMCYQAKACTRALLKGNEGEKEWKGEG